MEAVKLQAPPPETIGIPPSLAPHEFSRGQRHRFQITTVTADRTLQDLGLRLARALAEAEPVPERRAEWVDRFLRTLNDGTFGRPEADGGSRHAGVLYEAHFGLRELPFTITPDTGFFFPRSTHQDALNTLLVAARSGEGFVKITGEVGTGKTLLCRKFLNALDPGGFLTAYIPNPYLDPKGLLLAIADEFRVRYSQDVSQHQLLKFLNRFLLEAYARRKRVVVCLDEAQVMPLDTLESLRLLSNLETGRRKLLQVVLFGQPELDRRLAQPSIRQLKQRIAFSCGLQPLTPEETEYYLVHRLQVAGCRRPGIFARAAARRLHKASRGIPRLINILAHKAMMAAYGEGVRRIDEEHVRLAIADTESIHASVSPKDRVPGRLAALLITLLVLIGALVWGGPP
jgi:MSHA biogenesis protein MshM